MLWVDPYPARLPSWVDFRRLTIKEKIMSGQNVPTWLTVVHPKALPIEPLPGALVVNKLFWKNVLRVIDTFVNEDECMIGVGKPSELALEVLDRHSGNLAFYDAMDNFPAFFKGLSRASMHSKEQKIVKRVSRISVSSTRLTERFSDAREKVVIALNACAVDSLPPIPATPEGPEVSEKPVFGYVGMISHWFDWDLVIAIADSNPEIVVRLIGPAHVLPSARLPENIEMHPPCDHATAIRAMQEFSVGLIPFKKNELTEFVDPIKFYEYRALGLPVISTDFGEMSLRGNLSGVFLVDNGSKLSMLPKIVTAWECRVDEVASFRAENSWGYRFDSAGILP